MYGTWVTTLGFSNYRPFDKKQMCTINHIAKHKLSGQTSTACPQASSIQKYSSNRTFQELSFQQETKDLENSFSLGMRRVWTTQACWVNPLPHRGQKEPVLPWSSHCLLYDTMISRILCLRARVLLSLPTSTQLLQQNMSSYKQGKIPDPSQVLLDSHTILSE